MTISTIIDFLSRDCKSHQHESCHSKWEGLGFEIICSCKCHVSKKIVVLDEAPQSAANTLFENVCHHTTKQGDDTSR
jgi:hypothetical protein